MGRDFEITRLAIGQTVLDPNFASVVAVGWKSEQAHDHDPVVALFETCVEYYANLGPDTADLGMRKAISCGMDWKTAAIWVNCWIDKNRICGS